MNCPVCKSPIVSKGGENTKDFGCSNYNCSARSEAHYYPHISIIPGWHFAEMYHLPFKSGNDWFCVCGPENSWNISDNAWKERTILQSIEIHTPSVFNSFSLCTQKTLVSIQYMALPVNQDFDKEFTVLVERVMGRLMLK